MWLGLTTSLPCPHTKSLVQAGLCMAYQLALCFQLHGLSWDRLCKQLGYWRNSPYDSWPRSWKPHVRQILGPLAAVTLRLWLFRGASNLVHRPTVWFRTALASFPPPPPSLLLPLLLAGVLQLLSFLRNVLVLWGLEVEWICNKNTQLSNYIWSLKRENKIFDIKWSIKMEAKAYHPARKKCDLCLAEKVLILTSEDTLNGRTEIFQKCRHKNIFLLCNA